MISLLRSCQVGCWGKNKSSGLNAIRAGLISINLSASAGRCPGFAASRSLASAPLGPPGKELCSSINVAHLEYDLRGCGRRAGPLCPPLPRDPHRSAFHLALEDAAHIKVLDRKRRFGREAKSLKGRMKCLDPTWLAESGRRWRQEESSGLFLPGVSKHVMFTLGLGRTWTRSRLSPFDVRTFKRNITKQSPLIVSFHSDRFTSSSTALHYLLSLIEIIIFVSPILKHNKLKTSFLCNINPLSRTLLILTMPCPLCNWH